MHEASKIKRRQSNTKVCEQSIAQNSMQTSEKDYNQKDHLACKTSLTSRVAKTTQ